MFLQSLRFIELICVEYRDISSILLFNWDYCTLSHFKWLAHCVIFFFNRYRFNSTICFACIIISLKFGTMILAAFFRNALDIILFYVAYFKGKDNMTLSGALCGTFLSNGVLHRDVRASCIRSVLGCSASEYYCHCAMSVSFSRICNEIFANAVAGLRSSGTVETSLSWPGRISMRRSFWWYTLVVGKFLCDSRLRAHLLATVDRARTS